MFLDANTFTLEVIINFDDKHYMNAFDKHRKSYTAWCEECNEVFDKLWIANMHSDETGHRIKATEFWIIGRR
jgi:hypothetical protein